MQRQERHLLQTLAKHRQQFIIYLRLKGELYTQAELTPSQNTHTHTGQGNMPTLGARSSSRLCVRLTNQIIIAQQQQG